MERITVLSDGSRGIAYEHIIELFNEWMEEEQEERIRSEEQNQKPGSRSTWGRSCYCIVDYMDARQAVSASNAIRAFCHSFHFWSLPISNRRFADSMCSRLQVTDSLR